ncbi:MAG: hypothetical protein ACPLPR_10220 [Bacillota bacterium]
MKIDAKGMNYRDLNERIHEAVSRGAREVDLVNVLGHRYIGTGVDKDVTINIYGTPGSDLGAFMDGPTINVFGSAQDCVGNTMNGGTIAIHGDAGNVVGLSMRNGKLWIRGSVGYRVGIHMKAYQDKCPVIVVGGRAGDFLGEYMAGGKLIVLGVFKKDRDPVVGRYIGTGMHGGVIYIRGGVSKSQIGEGVELEEASQDDKEALRGDIQQFCAQLKVQGLDEILSDTFVKLTPRSKRPYGKLYAY